MSGYDPNDPSAPEERKTTIAQPVTPAQPEPAPVPEVRSTVATEVNPFSLSEITGKPEDQSEAPKPENPFSMKALGQSDDELRSQLHASAHVSTPVKPDEYAELYKTAGELGLAPGSISADLSHAKSVAAYNRMGLDRMVKRQPRLAAWLADPDNMAQAHDDVSSGVLQRIWDVWTGGLEQVNFAYRARALARAGIDPTTDEDLGWYAARMEKGQKTLDASERPLQTFMKGIQVIPGQAYGMATALAAAPVGAATAVGMGQPELIPVGIAVGMAAGSGYSTSIQEEGSAYYQYVQDMKASGEPVDLAKAAEAAKVVGAINGLVDAGGFAAMLTFLPGLKFLVPQEKLALQTTLRKTVGKAILGVGKELISESAQEGAQAMVTELGGNYAMDRHVDIENLLGTGWDEAKNSIEAFALTIGAGGGLSMHRQIQAYHAGENNEKGFREMHRLYQEARLANRNGEKMGELAGMAVEEGHPPNVYIGTEEFTRLFQEKMDPAEAAKQLGIGEEFTNAVAQGTDIAIPFEKFASKIANTQYFPPMIPDLKFGVDDLTHSERLTFRQNFAELQKLVKEIDDGTSKLGEHPAYAIRYQQLISTGHSEQDAQAQAMLHAAFVETMGEKTGENILKSFPLVVTKGEGSDTGQLNQTNFLERREWPEQRQIINHEVSSWADAGMSFQQANDEIDRLKAEGQITGAQESAFLREVGLKFYPPAPSATGESAVPETTYSPDEAELDKRLSEQRQRLTRLNQEVLETPEQKATREGGYTFTPAGQMERSGGKPPIRYFVSNKDMPDGGGKAGSKTTEEVIRRNGLDPDVPAGPKYGPASAAFKKWFEGSKVVDKNGNPLVLYHSSREYYGESVYVLDPSKETLDRLGHTVKPGQYIHSVDGEKIDTRHGDLGLHLTVDPKVADLVIRMEPGSPQPYEGNSVYGFTSIPSPSRVYPIYLKLKNPLRLEDNGFWGLNNIIPQLVRLGLVKDEASGYQLWADAESRLRERGEIEDLGGKQTNSAISREAIKSLGYDGVVYLNRHEISDSRGHSVVAPQYDTQGPSDETFKKKYPDAADSYIAFEDSQLKSAIANTGDYSEGGTILNEPTVQYGATPVVKFSLSRTQKKTKHGLVDHDVYKIIVNKKAVGHIVGEDRGTHFLTISSALDEQLRGQGLYQAARQQIANQYEDGVLAREWSSGLALQKSLAKMPTYEKIGPELWIRPEPKRLKTATRAFKTWFGSSVVINRDGTPKVMFHGTHGDFSEFKFTADIGFHFGTSQAAFTAMAFSDLTNQSVMPVYLRIRKALRLDDMGSWQSWELLKALLDKGVISTETFDKMSMFQTIELGHVEEMLRGAGYDGIVYKNQTEDVGSDSYIVFNSNQIKSAIGNRGTYGLTERNILKEPEAEYGAAIDASATEAVSQLPLPAEAKGALGRNEKRKKSKSEAGKPVNARTKIKLADGTTFLVGKISPKDWVDRWQARLTAQEWSEYAAWYRQVRSEYVKHYGTEAAPWFIIAWAAANQNVTPSGAQLNVLRALEQLRVPGLEGAVGGGLTHDKITEFWKLVAGEPHSLESLGSRKLYDFIDSCLGRQTRTWMENHPNGGDPAVVDVWSMRDTGFVTPVLKEWLLNNAANDRERAKVEALELDTTAKEVGGDRAPSEPQYEYGAAFLRLARAESVKRGLVDTESLTNEVQAVGWMGMLKMFGGEGQTPLYAITSRMRSFTVNSIPAVGAPRSAVLAPLMGLPWDKRMRAIRRINSEIVAAAARTVGLAHVHSRDLVIGATGNELNMAETVKASITPERSEAFAAALAYLSQQSEIWDIGHVSEKSKARKHIGIQIAHQQFNNQADLSRFWAELVNLAPDLADSFFPDTVDGIPALVMVRGDKADRTKGLSLAALEAEKNRIESILPELIQKASDAAGIDGHVVVSLKQFGLTALTNDWSVDHGGDSYLARVEKALGPGARDALLRHAAGVDQAVGTILAHALDANGTEERAGSEAVDPVAQATSVRNLKLYQEVREAEDSMEIAKPAKAPSRVWDIVDRAGLVIQGGFKTKAEAQRFMDSEVGVAARVQRRQDPGFNASRWTPVYGFAGDPIMQLDSDSDRGGAAAVIEHLKDGNPDGKVGFQAIGHTGEWIGPVRSNIVDAARDAEDWVNAKSIGALRDTPLALDSDAMGRAGDPVMSAAERLRPIELFRRVNKDFRGPGPVNFIGQKVTTAEDLAFMARTLRDPRWETFRIFWVKDGKIISHEGITTKNPGSATVIVGKESYDDRTARMRATKDALGADGYWMLHNHPSGTTHPSAADIYATGHMADAVPGLLGHVIINHKEYSHLWHESGINNAGVRIAKSVVAAKHRLPFSTKRQTQIGPDQLLGPELEAFKGRTILSASAVAQVGKHIRDGVSGMEKYVPVFYIDPGGALAYVEEVPVDLFKDVKRFRNHVRETARWNGSTRAMTYVTSDELYEVGILHIKKGTLIEVVSGGSTIRSGYSDRRTLNARAKLFPESSGRGERVNQRVRQGSPARILIDGEWKDEKIGSGENTAGQGWGHYFTSAAKAAEWYRINLSRRHRSTGIFFEGKEWNGAAFFEGFGNSPKASGLWRAAVALRESAMEETDPAKVIELAIAKLEEAHDNAGSLSMSQRGIDALKSGAFSFAPPGNVFEAEIPDDEHLIDWSKTMGEQPPVVLRRLRESGLFSDVVNYRMEHRDSFKRADNMNTRHDITQAQEVENWMLEEMTGKEFYRDLSESFRLKNLLNFSKEGRKIVLPVGQESAWVQGEPELVETGVMIGEMGYQALAKDASGASYIVHWFNVGPDGSKVDWSDYEVEYVEDFSWDEGGSGSKMSDKDASLALRASGIPGHTYKSNAGNKNFVLYDPGQAKFKGKLYQEKRGWIDLMSDGQAYHINLGDAANKSTFLHETGHMFLDIVSKLAAAAEADSQVLSDYDKILSWLGYANTGDRIDSLEEMFILAEGVTKATATDKDKERLKFLISREEKWADGFLAYLAAGKSPSPELVRSFTRFMAWLKPLYAQLQIQKVDVPKDIADAMGRMLATDSQIRSVEEHDRYIPMFKDAAEAGMTEAQFERYKQIAEEAHVEAYAEIDQRIKLQQEREAKSWWKEEWDKVLAEVTGEVDAKNSVKASRFLRDGTIPPDLEDKSLVLNPDGSPIKISTQAIDEMYGPMARTMKAKLGVGATTKEVGVHPDFLAQTFGFNSGDEMVRAIASEPSRGKQIATETKRRMVERHGDILNDGSIESVSREAVHDTKAHLKMLQLELDAMNRAAGHRVVKVSRQELEAYADQQIGSSKVRQINPDRFLKAERKSATEAMKAFEKGKFDEAVEWQKKRMVNRYLYSAAVKAKKRSDLEYRFLKRQDSTSERSKLGLMDTVDPATGEVTHSYLDQQDKLLEAYEIRKISGTESRRRESYRDWVLKELAANRDVVVAPNLLLESTKKNWQDMTLNELTELADAVRNIKHLADKKARIKVGNQELMYEAVIQEAAAEARANVKRKTEPEVSEENASWAERSVFDPLRRVDAELVRLREIAAELDGNNPNGIWHRILIHPLDDAAAREHELSVKTTKLIDAAIQRLPRDLRAQLSSRETVMIPSIGRTVLYSDLIAFGLNMGNASNAYKMLAGWQTERQGNVPWTEQTISELRSHLTEEHWDFIQEIWDALETLWPEAEALEKRLTGLAPKKVEVQGFTFTRPDGTKKEYRGGYYPVIYAPRFKGSEVRSTTGEGASPYDQNHDRAVTPHGHLIDRIETYSSPVSLKLERILGNMASVIHDTTHREALLEAYRFLSDQRIADVIIERMGQGYYRMMLERVRRVANSRNQVSYTLQKVHRVQGAIAAAMMGFKMSVSIQNLANFVLAARAVGTVSMGVATAKFSTAPFESYEAMVAVSQFMKHRSQQRDNELRQAFENTISLKAGKVKQIEGAIKRMGYTFMTFTNSLSEYPAWMAAFHNAQKKGMTEQEAVRVADDMVASTFGGGNVHDLAAVQDNESMKSFTMFYGFFSAVYNMTRKAGRGISKDWTEDRKGQAAWKAFNYLLWNVVVMNALSEIFSGRPPDDDELEDPGSFAGWLAAKGASYIFAMVPFIRDIYRSIDSGMSGGPKRDVSFTPLNSVGTEAASIAMKVAKAGHDLMTEEFSSEQLLGSAEAVSGQVIKVGSMLRGLPVSQSKITGGFLWDFLVNEDAPENWSTGLHDLFYTPKKKKAS